MEKKRVFGTGGELLVHQLVAQGVPYAFTNTGSAEAGFFNALLTVPGVQPILLLAESLVLSAADGYAKAARKPAFVNVHLAAGTRQGSGQLQNAYFDGTPMVVTAAMRDVGSYGDHGALVASGGFSQMGTVEDISKRRWEVWDAGGIPTVTRRAFKDAMTFCQARARASGGPCPRIDFMLSTLLVNIAMADAGGAIWESKYYYEFWRPVTGIRESDAGTGPTGEGDGNLAAIGIANFTPPGAPASNLHGPNFTQPFPAYPSGHVGFGGALFETVRKVLGTDANPFTLVFDEFNGTTLGNDSIARPLKSRSFASLWQAEEKTA